MVTNNAKTQTNITPLNAKFDGVINPTNYSKFLPPPSSAIHLIK
jgi:hypothetical protein